MRLPRSLHAARLRAGPVAAGVAALFVVLAMAAPRSAQDAGGPLLQAEHLTYVGAFLPPVEADLRYDHSGHGLTFSAERDSLFISNYANLVTEMAIPIPADGPLDTLPRAEVRQGPTDVLRGRRGEAGNMIGGLLIDGDDLIVSVYVLYDATGRASRSHFKVSTNFNDTRVAGPVQVGRRGAGFVGGPMARVPAAWQALVEGPALTSLCCVSIISRSSHGPTATVFNPADLTGDGDRIPGDLILGYPRANPELGEWDSSGTLFNSAVEMAGMAWIEGTASVLFFGRKGERYCYGSGEACGDPTSPHKGDHAYPYEYYVWAYDANDLVAARRGRSRPWGVKPYATWSFSMPFASEGRLLRGLAYDPATQRLYLSEQKAHERAVVIRVLEVVPPPS